MFNNLEIKNFGKKLQETRLNLGLSISNVSDNTGVDISQISRFEKGKFKRISVNLQIICKYLGVQLNLEASNTEQLLLRSRTVIERSSIHKNAFEGMLDILEKFL